jgi:hypothetical protein
LTAPEVQALSLSQILDRNIAPSMLTALHPELLAEIQGFPAGLCALRATSRSDRAILVVKTLKEGILAARLNRNVKIYLPSLSTGAVVAGLVTAFFDDVDEPLVLRSPLFDEEQSRLLLAHLQQAALDVHFFDEHTRELLAFRCSVAMSSITGKRLKEVPLEAFSYPAAAEILDQMQEWFALRGAKDDAEAITLAFEESLMPEDVYLMDLIPENNAFIGARAFSASHLVRDEPGRLQEHDIALSLNRVFPASQIYKSPLRIKDREEISDLLVISNSSLLFVQAKDSPNTEGVLRNSIDRKRATARKALTKALGQTRGAVRYAKSAEPMAFFVGTTRVEVAIAHLPWRALVVVKELFDSDREASSSAMLQLGREVGLPCVALDYGEFNMYTSNLRNEQKFVAALDRAVGEGERTGIVPRLRFGPNGAF